jgi:hypothetical protein
LKLEEVPKTQSFPNHQEFDPELHDGLSKIFDVSTYLDFPFKLEEVANYFLPGSNMTAADLLRLLSSDKYADLKFVIKDGYLFTRHDQSIDTRSQREAMSAAKLIAAAGLAKQLARLVPFIRTIAVTGSVAYGSAEKWDDIDLFVVTDKRRLWISAFLMLCQVRLYKVLGLRAPHLSNFCLSYVHDQEGFSNESRKNRASALFARELLKAEPVAGKEEYRRILKENGWVNDLYSNPYSEKLKLLEAYANGRERLETRPSGLHCLLLDLADGIFYVTLSRYLRIRAYLANLKLGSEGKTAREFEPIISPSSCVYTSNFYRWLHALWENNLRI